LPLVLAGHREVVPDCIAFNEVKPVILDVQACALVRPM
jgi:hypothetical protein